jgi:glyoxylate reductase
MPKIFITRTLPKIAEEILHKHHFEVTTFSKNRSITKRELIKEASDADGIISLLTDPIDKDVIDNLKCCKVIANYAVGYNNIDTNYARKKNIIVTNTPDILTDATADLTLTLILSCARRLVEGDKMIRTNKFKGWSPNLLLGTDINNKILGVIGAGRIGSAVIKRASAFGMKSIYYNRSRNLEIENLYSSKKVSLDYLLKNSDVISIHLPLNPGTKNLLNKEKLSLLKNNSILINTARGEIIDENHLIQLLKMKKIFAAGLDVYVNEPNINIKFLKLSNVILAPHIGSATIETRSKMAELAVKNVINVLKGKKPLTPVV